MYIREFEAVQSSICWFNEQAMGKNQKNDLIWFRQLSIIFSISIIDDYSLWMLFYTSLKA